MQNRITTALIGLIFLDLMKQGFDALGIIKGASVNEFIACAYQFRLEPNQLYARTEFSLAACEEEYIAETAFTCAPNLLLARGNAEPLLGMPMLRAAEQ